MVTNTNKVYNEFKTKIFTMHASLAFYHPHQKRKLDPKFLQGHGSQKHFRYNPLLQWEVCTSKCVAYKKSNYVIIY